MKTTTYSVPEVHCEHCVASIEGALAPLAGVVEVAVDLDAKTVTVEHDDRPSPRELAAAIEDQGYEVASHEGPS